jgi:hypothetical protein
MSEQDFLLPLREKVVAGWRPDEGYCEASLLTLVRGWMFGGSLCETPHPTFASADKFMQSA